MNLVQVGQVVWRILAIEDAKGQSAWAELERSPASDRHAGNMQALLFHVLSNGPPRDASKSKHLRDKIFEFRRGPKTGPKLRLLWFYDEDERRVIICTHLFRKKKPQVESEIDKAVDLRKAYFRAKRARALTVRKDEA